MSDGAGRARSPAAGTGSDHRAVAIVGPGRVGTTLATALSRAGFRIVGAAGGRDASRQRFADHLAGSRTDPDPAAVVPHAGTVILATPDDAIEPVVTALATADAFVEGQRVVHVAGARGLGVLRRAALAGCRVAACAPAQTVPGTAVDPDRFVGSAWAVTCAEEDRGWATELVEAVGGDAHPVPDDRRTLYHAALAIGSNAVGAAVAVARQLLIAARVDDPRAFLDPLLSASISNVLADGPAALTGPLVRGDLGTIRDHLAHLDADVPRLATAYRDLSRVVLAQVGAGLDPDTRARLEDLLDEHAP